MSLYSQENLLNYVALAISVYQFGNCINDGTRFR